MLKFTIFRRMSLWSLAAILAGTTSISVNANPIQISQGPQQSKLLRGFTRGTVGLHNIVGNRDQNQNRCMGYGSASPDHQLELKSGITQISFQVRTQRQDSTLVIKGPGNAVFCADDSSFGKDAGIKLNNLPPGQYEVWVGSFDAGKTFPYTLSIQ
jgi:hypothetical protein